MLPAEQARGEALVALARTHFDSDLLPIEEQVLRHSCAYEDPADWTPDPATPDPTRHETTGRPLLGSQLPAIRPTLLRWLLTTSAATDLLEPRGLRVWNARLTAPLDLIGCTIPARLELRYCLVEAPIHLANASLPTLSLRNSTLEQTLDAPFLKLHGPLNLDDITAAETLNFNAATIPAEVRLSNTVLMCSEKALCVQGADIANDLLLAPNFISFGSLYMTGIRVGGLISLTGAQINTSKGAMDANEAVINGNFFINNGFRAASEVRMRGAAIGGQLNCNKSKFLGEELNLLVDGAKINQGVYLREIESNGLIRMLGAQINGDLDFAGAKLSAPKRTLWLENVRIRDHVMFNNGFYSKSMIQMMGAYVGGQVMCQDASIGVFSATAITVVRDFIWMDITNAGEAKLKLRGATLGSFRDNKLSWPHEGNLFVNGMSTAEIRLHSPRTEEERKENTRGEEHPLRAVDRIAWLNLQPESHLSEAQPWMHLASLLEAKGHKRAAKRVTYELRKHQSRDNWKNSRFKRLGYVWDTCFARLEQEPFCILIPILLLASLSGTTFHAYRAHFAPTNDTSYKNAENPDSNPERKLGGLPLAYPQFNSFVYALEDVLPVIKLGQDDKWAPAQKLDAENTHHRVYWSLAILRWVLILAGWVMGGILAAAVSARFRA